MPSTVAIPGLSRPFQLPARAAYLMVRPVHRARQETVILEPAGIDFGGNTNTLGKAAPEAVADSVRFYSVNPDFRVNSSGPHGGPNRNAIQLDRLGAEFSES